MNINQIKHTAYEKVTLTCRNCQRMASLNEWRLFNSSKVACPYCEEELESIKVERERLR